MIFCFVIIVISKFHPSCSNYGKVRTMYHKSFQRSRGLIVNIWSIKWLIKNCYKLSSITVYSAYILGDQHIVKYKFKVRNYIMSSYGFEACECQFTLQRLKNLQRLKALVTTLMQILDNYIEGSYNVMCSWELYFAKCSYTTL